jgi:predicted esterase
LSKLYEKIQQVYAPEKITLLGFSQGAATAARWYQKHPDGFDQLILWAAVFPPDIEAGSFPTEKPLHFVLGTQDEYYQGDAAKSLLTSYENLGFRVHFFDGKHEIQERVLTSILST